jgi:hypothetical protein
MDQDALASSSTSVTRLSSSVRDEKFDLICCLFMSKRTTLPSSESLHDRYAFVQSSLPPNWIVMYRPDL